jgi:prepilin peptidase CpaA
LLKISDPLTVSAVAAGGASSTAVDLYARRIPNKLTFATALVGIAIAVTGVGPLTVTEAAFGFVIGLVLMLPGYIVGATGAGDVKLFAALGTLLGPSGVLLAFLYTALAGGALAIIVALQRRMLRETVARAAMLISTGGSNVGEIETARVNRFAYAPAIAIGALIAALGF